MSLTTTTTATSDPLLESQVRRDMIETCGRLAQRFGMARSVGQIYGLLFLAVSPLSLDDVAQMIGISKGSASTGTRQLLSWGAIRQVWVQGTRRDYFEAVPDIVQIIRTAYTDFFKPRLAASGRRIDGMTAALDDELARRILTEDEHKVCSERLQGLGNVQRKLQAFVPFAEKLM